MNDVAFHSPAHSDNQKFVEFARLEIGSRVQIDNFSRDFGRPSIVWRLTGSDGSRTWLKHHESQTQFCRELIGLESYVPALGDQTWWSSPTLVAKNDTLDVILMSEVDGEILATTTIPADDEWTMFCFAGRFARMLHDLDCTSANKTDASTNLRDRLEYYLTMGEASVDVDTIVWTRSLINQASRDSQFIPVPCHRDFSPRNWLFKKNISGIRFGVIDWERSGQDLWLQDVQRMSYDHWHNKPQLREAYFEGYGREPTVTEKLQLDALCLVGAIAGISWAITHNDFRFAATNRETIARIRLRHAN